jgi:hypothetical protein
MGYLIGLAVWGGGFNDIIGFKLRTTSRFCGFLDSNFKLYV